MPMPSTRRHSRGRLAEEPPKRVGGLVREKSCAGDDGKMVPCGATVGRSAEDGGRRATSATEDDGEMLEVADTPQEEPEMVMASVESQVAETEAATASLLREPQVMSAHSSSDCVRSQRDGVTIDVAGAVIHSSS